MQGSNVTDHIERIFKTLSFSIRSLIKAPMGSANRDAVRVQAQHIVNHPNATIADKSIGRSCVALSMDSTENLYVEGHKLLARIDGRGHDATSPT